MKDDWRSALHRPWCLQKAHDPLTFKDGDPVLKDPKVLAEMIAASSPCPCRAVSANMSFIRLSWLLDKDNDLRNMPSMQQLQEEAFIPQTEMEQVYFVSHRWLDETHPDRSGRQLAVALSKMWCDANEFLPGYYPENWKEAHKIGVWYDYLCLPQHPRTPEEQRLFDRLLPEIAALTLCTMPILVVDADMEYSTRAWCVAEAAGVYQNGFTPTVLSLYSQVYRYRDVFFGEEQYWSLSEEEKGFSAGVAKLLQWIRETIPKIPLDIEDCPRAVKEQVRAGAALGKKLMSILYASQQMSGSDSTEWLALAHQSDLHCTRNEDLKLCMDLIRRVTHKDFGIEPAWPTP